VCAFQEQPKDDPPYEFFAGTVLEFDSEKLTVSRSGIDSATEHRTFILKPETRIDGKLRAKARVTVGFRTSEEGDVAMRVIVRPSSPRK
jgi:hypothetical protein